MGFEQNKVLEKAASALEELERQNSELREKLASFEKKDRCEKIAMRMIEKGLVQDEAEAFTEKVAELMGSDKLDIIEQAVDMSIHALTLGSEDDREKVASKKLNPIEALILDGEY